MTDNKKKDHNHLHKDGVQPRRMWPDLCNVKLNVIASPYVVYKDQPKF
jgi:hypothetical protein